MRLADALALRLQRGATDVRLRTARLDAFTTGHAQITLAGASLTDVPYLASYSPTVGNTVLLLQTGGGQLLILGKAA